MSETAVDIVFIRDLEVKAVIGVFDWEREITQKLIFNLEMATDITQAVQTDDIKYALDYDAISRAVKSLVEASDFQLVESLAEAVAQMIIKDFQVKWLRLSLDKPGAVAFAKSVGVSIERGQA